MKITRSREHTVNLGNYENVKIGASVEFEIQSARDLDVARTNADDYLDLLLKRDLDEALANVPSSTSTHLETWGK